MEWVETTGKTVDEAKDAALDQLGVDEQDAEFEVLEEPRAGLFGRTRGEARVRARVRPTQPRPKTERRDRRGRSGRGGAKRAAGTGGAGNGKTRPTAKAAATGAAPQGDDAEPAAEVEVEAGAGAAVAVDEGPRPEGGGGQRRSRRGGSGRNGTRRAQDEGDDDEGSTDMSDTELAEQGEVVRAFLLDLVDAFGFEAEVTTATGDDGAVELAVDGDDLGLLIGPKGQTLQAIQELSRSALQRQKPGESHARIRVDVGGYRERRREALARFTREVAEQVKSSGVQKALEPMSPPDRKVVHDTVNEIDGVTTVSEGEDARRRVVILPA
jgi:spoIIIJ-associated protein